jgi:hypothetical protein
MNRRFSRQTRQKITPVTREEHAMRKGRLRAWLRRDAGMNTAEYAVGTLAAVAFAGLLLKVLTSGRVQAALAAVIDRALG